MDFAKVAMKIPEVLLPQSGIDLRKWAVVACDQFTSQPEYWENVAVETKGVPSTFELIFPEVYLGKGNDRERISQINAAMRRYLDTGLLGSPGAGLVYVERQTAHGNLRKGLIATVDLEAYDYRPGATSLIRATEGTVLDRLPPRVKIREQAVLELPHIMLLIDDPEALVIEPLSAQTECFTKLYDTDLMLQGGHVKGYLIDKPDLLKTINAAISLLAEPELFRHKYGLPQASSPLLFAVGDGNHSLATAKAVWENLKQQPGIDRERHPARYALVEIVNLHDPGLQFEPIHRVLFQAPVTEFCADLTRALAPCGVTVEQLPEGKAVLGNHLAGLQADNVQKFGMVFASGTAVVTVAQPSHNLTVGTLQAFLDNWITQHPESKLDYIHGDDVVAELGAKPGNIGLVLPPLAKDALFKTVIVEGVLPRKTFSMGEAAEKRYYLECRKIV